MKKLLIAVLLLVVLPVAIIVGINLMDEPLDARAASTGEPRAPSVPEAENGYYALLALGAADGANSTESMAYAKTFVNESRAAAKDNRDEKQPPQKRAKRPDVCDPQKVSCLNTVRDKASDFNKALEAYKEDLARYQTLLAAQKFEEVLDFPPRMTTGLPPATALTAARQAHLTQAALDLEGGNTEAAANAVEQSLNFYRVMLTGSRTAMGRVMAVSGYNTSVAFAKDALAQHSAVLAAHLPKWQEAANAMSTSAPGFDAVFDTEFGALKTMARDPAAAAAASNGPSWAASTVAKFLHQPQATQNQARRSFDAMSAAARLPAGEFKAAWTKITKPYGEMGFKDYLINPIGKIMLSIGIPDMSQVVMRQHEALANNAALLKDIDASLAAAAAAAAATTPATEARPAKP